LHAKVLAELNITFLLTQIFYGLFTKLFYESLFLSYKHVCMFVCLSDCFLIYFSVHLFISLLVLVSKYPSVFFLVCFFLFFPFVNLLYFNLYAYLP
jgi:hypothetical protein